MFLKVFKSQNPFIIILALLILFGLWFYKLFFYDISTDIDIYGNSLLYDKLTSLIGSSPFLFYFIPLVSIIIMFFIIVRFNLKFILYDNRTYLPAIIFILLSSSIVSLQGFYPVFIAAPLVLYSIFLTFSTFKVDKPFSFIFLSSFMLALSSMFYHFTIYLIVFIWISLFIIRTPNIREIAVSIVGIIVPYLLWISYLFAFDDLSDFLNNISNIYSNIPAYQDLHYSIYIFLGIVLLLFILTMIFSFNGIYIKKIDARKFFKSFVVFLFVSVIIFLIFPSLHLFIIVSIPLSFLISIYLLNWRNKFFTELVFTLLILSIIYIQLVNYLDI